jgi:hypothetical protein
MDIRIKHTAMGVHGNTASRAVRAEPEIEGGVETRSRVWLYGTGAARSWAAAESGERASISR